MAVPVCFMDAYATSGPVFVDDVQDIMDLFDAQVLGMTPAWTEPSTDLYKSPVDASSRWFDVLLTRISATNLDVRTRTSGAVTVDQGRMQIPAAGTNVVILTGEHYFHIEAYVSSYSEFAFGGIADMTPESQTVISTYYYANAYRTTANAVRSNVNTEHAFAWTGSAYGSDQNLWHAYEYRNQTSYMISGITGAYVWGQVYLTNANKYGGRLYNHVYGNSAIPVGAQVVVPLDIGTNGTFLAMAQSSQQYRQFIRIG